MSGQDPFGLTASGIPPELQAQYRGLTREQAIQQALLQQSQQPVGGVIDAGMFKVARSPWEGLSKIAQAYMARKNLDRNDERMGELGNRAAQMQAEEVRRYQQMKAGVPGSSETIVDEQANGGEGAPATIDAPAVAADPRAAVQMAMLSRNPMLQRLGQMDYQSILKRDEPAILPEGAQRIGPDGKVIAENKKDFKPQNGFKAGDTRKLINGEQEIVQEYQADGTWKEVGKGPRFARQVAPVVVAGGGSKPQKAPVGYRFSSDGESLEPIPGGPKDPGVFKLPTQALRLQQAEVDAIGTSAAIKADLGRVIEQLSPSVDAKTGAAKPPALQLGLFNNAVGSARNYIGMSDENSRNLGSFKATLEKLRNDSLRLNKGVQTEGDAVRAWNEILANPNDQEFVKKRLAEVQEINDRAIDLRKMNIDNIRRNYGAPPLDTSGQEVVRPAIGNAPASPKGTGGVPAGVDPNVWAVMTPQEKALFK